METALQEVSSKITLLKCTYKKRRGKKVSSDRLVFFVLDSPSNFISDKHRAIIRYDQKRELIESQMKLLSDTSIIDIVKKISLEERRTYLQEERIRLWGDIQRYVGGYVSKSHFDAKAPAVFLKRAENGFESAQRNETEDMYKKFPCYYLYKVSVCVVSPK